MLFCYFLSFFNAFSMSISYCPNTSWAFIRSKY
nr:MAG TPA: hypothetical protein [Bacteriophage sp.]